MFIVYVFVHPVDKILKNYGVLFKISTWSGWNIKIGEVESPHQSILKQVVRILMALSRDGERFKITWGIQWATKGSNRRHARFSKCGGWEILQREWTIGALDFLNQSLGKNGNFCCPKIPWTNISEQIIIGWGHPKWWVSKGTPRKKKLSIQVRN